MKIKFLSLLLLLLSSSVTWARPIAVNPIPFAHERIVSIWSNVDQSIKEVVAKGDLPKSFESLAAEELFCEFDLEVDITYGGATFEVTITVIGNCDEGVEKLREKISNVKDLVSTR